MQKIILLGSTGSIGRQTLEIVRNYRNKFKVVGLAAGNNFALLNEQIKEFRPLFVAVKNHQKLQKARFKVLSIEELAVTPCDLLVSAIAGVAGLEPTLLAIQAGRWVALANKESLVLAGDLVMRAAKKSGAKILPVDSEHSAFWQLLEKVDTKKIRRVIITASGGALRDFPLATLGTVNPSQVLVHPTWSMGAKVTLDSATLANKAYEIIEAHHLFGLPYEKIEAVIHPQSLVHALVETIDGAMFAQLAEPDMRLPIQHALFGGERQIGPIPFLELAGKNLEFKKIERERYPLFEIILEAARRGGLAPTVAATAAELAGEKFLAGKIKFTDISKIVRQQLLHVPDKPASFKNILEIATGNF